MALSNWMKKKLQPWSSMQDEVHFYVIEQSDPILKFECGSENKTIISTRELQMLEVGGDVINRDLCQYLNNEEFVNYLIMRGILQ